MKEHPEVDQGLHEEMKDKRNLEFASYITTVATASVNISLVITILEYFIVAVVTGNEFKIKFLSFCLYLQCLLMYLLFSGNGNKIIFKGNKDVLNIFVSGIVLLLVIIYTTFIK